MRRDVPDMYHPDGAITSSPREEWIGHSCERLLKRCFAARVPLILLFFLLASPVIVSAETGRGYIDLGGGYKTGAFGTNTTSDLYYFSPTIGYVASGYELSITVPYLSLTNKTVGQSRTESGIGDTILRGGAMFIPESPSGFSLNGTLALKLPTADETRGLGTGETDYGAFLGFHQRSGNTTVSLTGGYILVGDPAAIDYNNISLYGISLSNVFGNTYVTLSLEGRRAMISGAKDPREVSAAFFHVLNSDYAIRGSVFKGLNNGGPDGGLDAGVVRWF